MKIILMGVSGSGKSTVGERLSAELNIPFFDGDDFHPQANIDKMSRGEPLNDDDRLPWLMRLRELLEEKEAAIVACSALKAAYRDILAVANTHFVYLRGDFDLIYRRLSQRENHFMSPDMLKSQFAALEEPTDAKTVSIAQPIDQIVQTIIEQLRLN